MNILANLDNQKNWERLSALKNTSDEERDIALRKRLIKNPYATDLEYLLGAFIEMYPPYLHKIIFKLAQKGYAIDPSSGFGGNNSEFQTLNGNFTFNYIIKNKLEKTGIKMRDSNGFKSLIFWSGTATLDDIKTKWLKIIDLLPDKGTLKTPSMSGGAVVFRRKYLPERSSLKKQRLFEMLKDNAQMKIDTDIKRRQIKNPHSDKTEFKLGLFVEELEPQVRQAILKLYQKGYSTDVSGFMDSSDEQMIEGDFQLEEKTVSKLEVIGVKVDTNLSGYTRIHFLPEEANIIKIKNKWNKIASLIPDKKRRATPSMTRKARYFREVFK